MEPTVEIPDAVLFCCTMNAIRSPMAEGLMKAMYGTTAYVDSVGVRAGEPDGFMIAVMQELGIDTTRHKAKTFDELNDGSFDLIIAMSPEAQHHAVEMTRTMACDVEFWNTLDPTIIEGSREERLAAYRQVRDLIRKRLENRFGPPRNPLPKPAV